MKRIALIAIVYLGMLSTNHAQSFPAPQTKWFTPLMNAGDVDLTRDKALSKPFTIFDQLLYSLNRDANNDVKLLHPWNGDFTPFESEKALPSDASAVYVKVVKRTILTYSISVLRMNDPWQAVCKKYLQQMVRWSHLQGAGSQSPSRTEGAFPNDTLFLARHLGPAAWLDKETATSLQPFVDSMVVTIVFTVYNAKGDVLDERECAMDIKNDHIKYYRHR